MFSQTVEYALRAAVWLAAHQEQPQTTQQIADATLVPVGYLSKVMQSLIRARLARAQRGKGGGFMLACSAAHVSVLEVINSVEPFQRIKECPLGIEQHGARLCPLHKRLDAAMAGVEQAFAETSIADVLSEPSPSKPLCRISEAQNVA